MMTLRHFFRKDLGHLFFVFSVILKGLDGIVEIITGILAFVISATQLTTIVQWLVHKELLEDTHDLFANYLLHTVAGFSPSTQTFVGLYLLSHGVIKVFLVVNLLQKRLWAYPLAITVFSLFIIYQIYAYLHTPNLNLLVLTGIDLAVIILTTIEYKKLRKPSVTSS